MYIKDLDSYVNQEITINGNILSKRQQKNYTFIKLIDGSNVNGLQLVIDNNNINCDLINTGTTINVCGLLVESLVGNQKYELQVDNLKIIGMTDLDNYPLAKTKMSLLHLRNYPHLRFRTNTFGCVFRIKSSINHATHLFFHNNNYLHLDPNIITINECEGGAGVFQVTEFDLSKKTEKHDWSKDHFDKPVYLTVSSQLQLEAISCSLGPVYTTNKSFRSEHSNTNKHLSEFTHLEIENTFIDLDYLLDISEKYIKYIANYLLDNNNDDLIFLNSNEIVKNISNIEFIRLDYFEAINLLNNNSQIKIKYGDDLSSEAENFLTEYYLNKPVFVTNWPIDIKSFYMKRNDKIDDIETCANFDLLMPNKVGELIGGSMREDNLDKLLEIMKIKNINPEPLDFYLDLRRFGTVPHGGFGLGLDRLCMLFTKIENIRDVVPFPVTYKNCSL